MNETTMRSIRLEHGVSLKELAEAVGVSTQHISNVELGIVHGKTLELAQKAFETVIDARHRRLICLIKSYYANRDRLLEVPRNEL
ncbi:hypothetical protein FACS189492_2990 [Clostridia bacterium]|nr:hypothetical protein FACS189492_2990 [Clostridia bacterium]